VCYYYGLPEESLEGTISRSLRSFFARILFSCDIFFDSFCSENAILPCWQRSRYRAFCSSPQLLSTAEDPNNHPQISRELRASLLPGFLHCMAFLYCCLAVDIASDPEARSVIALWLMPKVQLLWRSSRAPNIVPNKAAFRICGADRQIKRSARCRFIQN